MKTTTRRHTAPLARAVSLLSLSLLAVFTGLSFAEESPIYKSIAEDGSTIFTDQPAADATIIKPPPLNVMDAVATKPTTAGAPTSGVQPSAIIENVVIDQPTHQQTFNDPKDPIWVQFNTSPAKSLPTGITANIRVDGILVVTGNRHRMPIDAPIRGAHQIQVQLVDESGSIIAESELVEIFVKQHVAGGVN
ncbi:hypothetical protein [Granulosicoccus antarcticus]|uniref:DUF4124 domain-containing protein n=1 Tax=Granulosicoccus antarcticus IMCC3135 TaxID=1192854 RepID=A0A2Z2NIB1_9GAMM|nr:hypothetical protein [Granulosicoccus antarcticus]ASJ71072.1 hypothetical protein IMCC3135_04795 [Granulosicoccus antarcticus IMCC3135]